jgi:hypothetical protein
VLRQENEALQSKVRSMRMQIATHAAIDQDLCVTIGERDLLQVHDDLRTCSPVLCITRLGMHKQVRIVICLISQVKLATLQRQLEDDHTRSIATAAADAAALRQVCVLVVHVQQ